MNKQKAPTRSTTRPNPKVEVIKEIDATIMAAAGLIVERECGIGLGMFGRWCPPVEGV